MSNHNRQPRRQGTNDSARSGSSRSEATRQHPNLECFRTDTDQSIQELADVLYEEEKAASTSNANSVKLDLPPAYDGDNKSANVRIAEKPSLVLDPSGHGHTNGFNSKTPLPDVGLNITSRILWPILLSLPVIAAGAMLYLITCSDAKLRMDMSLVKVGLPANVFNPLLEVANKIGRGSISQSMSDEINAEMEETGNDLFKRAGEDVAGWLGTSTWGWCMKSVESDDVVCSEVDGWYDMYDLVSSAKLPSGSIGPDSFEPGLLHGLSTHGLAMVATMASLVPIGLLTWRRYVNNNSSVEAGWVQHGLLLAAAVFAMTAYIIDRLLMSSVKESLPSFEITPGPAPTLTLISSILLFVTFLSLGYVDQSMARRSTPRIRVRLAKVGKKT